MLFFFGWQNLFLSKRKGYTALRIFGALVSFQVAMVKKNMPISMKLQLTSSRVKCSSWSRRSCWLLWGFLGWTYGTVWLFFRWMNSCDYSFGSGVSRYMHVMWRPHEKIRSEPSTWKSHSLQYYLDFRDIILSMLQPFNKKIRISGFEIS